MTVANSTIQLQEVVDYGRTFPDLTPVLKAGGYADQPARNIADRVMAALLGGALVDGQQVGPFPWKWNRVQPAPFWTNSWQQDYASRISPNTLGWLQDGVAIDIFNTAQPKPEFGLEVVRDLSTTGAQFGRPQQVCWLYNKDLQYGVWGGDISTVVGPPNPAASSVYTNPLGAASTPANPIMQIIDVNGNYLLLTGYGVEGSTAPLAAAAATPGTVATPGAGATTQWTVVDPYGPGFRLSPRPPQTGVTWTISLVGQKRPVRFTTLQQTLDPLPDDFAVYFKEGFIVHCYRHSPELRIRGKFQDEFKLWMQGLQEALGKADKEREPYGFYPDTTVMDHQGSGGPIGPAWPWPPGLVG